MRIQKSPLDKKAKDEEIVIWSLLQRYGSLCGQQFVENSGEDYRIHVINNQIASSFVRTSQSSDLRVKDLINPYIQRDVLCTPEMKDIALTSCEILGLDSGSVDFIKSTDGFTVLEVNPATTIWGKEKETVFHPLFTELILQELKIKKIR